MFLRQTSRRFASFKVVSEELRLERLYLLNVCFSIGVTTEFQEFTIIVAEMKAFLTKSFKT